MANYNICFSPTGGTRRVTDIITNALRGDFAEIDLCKDPGELHLADSDICIVGVPSYGGRVPSTAIERLARLSANGARAVLVCAYGNREWDDTLTELQDTLQCCGFRCIGAIAAVAEHSIFRQYASGRPDKEDAKQLGEFSLEIQNRLDENFYPNLELPGSHDKYKDFGGSPLKPIVDSTICHGCGICADECPTGAIDADNPIVTDSDRCISCMRCISICPNQARGLNQDLFQQLEQLIGPRLTRRKKNHLFI